MTSAPLTHEQIRELHGEERAQAWREWDEFYATAPVGPMRLVHEVGDPRAVESSAGPRQTT